MFHFRYEDKLKDINSPDSNDSGIQADVTHIQGPVNDDLYAVPNKPKKSPRPQLKSTEVRFILDFLLQFGFI